MNRRLFLASGTCLATLAGFGLSAGALLPRRVAAAWPADLFYLDRLDAALAMATGGAAVAPSDDLEILADAIAENGATVPVSIQSRLPATRAITLLSDANPNPALARCRIGSTLIPRLSLRVKMGGSGHLVALAETDNGFFIARKAIKVTAGGCA
jgi:sulfur-oxidizing protein SoxY